MRSSFFFGFFPSGRTVDGAPRSSPPKGSPISVLRTAGARADAIRRSAKKETVSESGDIFLGKTSHHKGFLGKLSRKSFRKARTLLFDLFSCEMFALTSGGSAYRRRQHQYLHPARVYAPAAQENPASEKTAARAAGARRLAAVKSGMRKGRRTGIPVRRPLLPICFVQPRICPSPTTRYL